MYLTQFDQNTWLHVCDIIGVQDVTENYRVEGGEDEPICLISLSNGTACPIRSPLKVVLMTIDEAMEQHTHGHEEEEEQ